MTQDNFYRAFEDKFRGSRKLIKDRLAVYLPFILKLKDIYKKEGLKALDLGCGRGEWLELLKQNGIDGIGIDLDDGMLAACKERNLDTVKADVVSYILKQEDNSFIMISGFHIAEHLPFEELKRLIEKSLRLLKPGGLLILETPNPENISVATLGFYIDPSHIKPIPPALLLFLTEYYGFENQKILRLQELKDFGHISLMQVINGVSPDYAVVAQKQASPEILHRFNDLFSKKYGLSLADVMNRYNDRLSESETQNKQVLIQIAEQAGQYHAVMNSNSWKITRPLRFISKVAMWFMRGTATWVTFAPNSRPRRTIKKLIIYTKDRLNEHPKAKYFIKLLLMRFPKLKDRLINIGRSDEISLHNTPPVLSPKAKRIYDELKAMLNNKK